MSMTREEIVERLSTSSTVNDFRKIEDDIRNDIAERDEPVTRAKLTDRYGKPAKLMDDRVWTVNENFEVREEDLRFVVRRSLGHFVAYVETMGQLLDLLSGLGVTK